MFPVPLNSSKITSSILLPVSTRAVAIMVRLPPSSIFLAAPKKRLGFWSALESKPPDRIFPLGGTTELYARANRVMLSKRIMTSSLCSTSLFAFSITISATWTWRCCGSSKVELMTSASTDRSMSVTSSGLSSIRRTILWISLSLALTLLAMFWRSIVFPVLGGATIRPRWPFPRGVIRSRILEE